MKKISAKLIGLVLTFVASFAVIGSIFTVVSRACAAGLGETEVPDILK